MDHESDSNLSEGSELVSTKSFYGKNIQSMRPRTRPNPVVKIARLPDSVIEEYDKGLSSSTVDCNGPRIPMKSNERKVLLGSRSTRHNVKRRKKPAHLVRRFRGSHQANDTASNHIDSLQSEDLSESESVTCISTEDEEMNGKVQVKSPNLSTKAEKISRRRKASAVSAEKIAKFYNKRVLLDDDDESSTEERRIIPKRQASAAVAKKIAMAYDSSSEDESSFISKGRFYKGKKSQDSSDFSSIESDDTSSNYSSYSRVKTSKMRKNTAPPALKISDYEKTAQEKVALRMKFLKSLKGFSSD